MTFSPASLRDFLQILERRSELRAVPTSVDPMYEISAHLALNGAGPALRFDNVAGSGMRVVGNLLCSRERIAAGLGVPLQQLQSHIVRAIAAPLDPAPARSAPCQEVVEENPDLATLPIPTFFEHETGPYITAGIIAACDAQTGKANLSYARLKPLGGNRAFIGIAPNHHLAVMARRAKTLPIAVTLGNSPAVMIAAALYLGYGEDELRVAGALQGAPIETIKCFASQIVVPASCEMVLEGVLRTDATVEEGLVSEYHGLYENYGAGYVVEFSHLTRRRDAMLQVIQPGYHPEHVWIGAEAIAAGLAASLATPVAITPGGAGRLHAVVALKGGDARELIRKIWDTVHLVKHVTVVDADIDAWDATRVELAIATCMRADRDLLVEPAMPSNRSDPQARGGKVPKLGIDATRKVGERDWTPAAPPLAVLEKIRKTLT